MEFKRKTQVYSNFETSGEIILRPYGFTQNLIHQSLLISQSTKNSVTSCNR